MDPRDVLHWSALVTALFALAWALGQLVGPLVPLAMLLGVVAATLLIVAARRVPEQNRSLFYAGAVGALVVHVVFVLLLMGESSFTFGEANPRSINENPPQLLSDIKNFLARYIGTIGMVLFTLAYWPLWGSRDRGLAIGAVGLNVLVLVLALAGVGGGQEATGFDVVLPILFAISFLPFAAALLLPIFLTEAPGAWGPPAAPAAAKPVSRRKTRKP